MASADAAAQGQQATGSGIAQALGDHASATVNYYELARPEPVNESKLAAAMAKLAALPVDVLPELGPLPGGSRALLPHNPLFVGRVDDMLTLARTLRGGATAPVGQTAAVTGLGGMGKTQLAAEFVHRYGRFFAGGVFWFRFASAESIPAEIAACGGVGAMDLRPDFAALKQNEQMAAVLARWQDGLPRLLVFDNCESPELLERWRPPSGACRVLVTSRRAEWDPALGVQRLALDVLPRAASVALLRGFRPELSADNPDLDAIAGELGDLPLALHLAGSYMHQFEHSPFGAPAKLLEELRKPERLEHQALTGAGEYRSPTGHELSVARTFAISYDQLRAEVEIDALAQRALANAACLAPGEPIPRGLLLLTLELDDAQSLAGEEALQRLTSLGLLETEKDGALRLHRLVAAFVRRLDPSAQVVETVEAALLNEAARLITAAYPAPLLGWQVHLRWLARQAERRGGSRAGHLYNWFGRYLRMVGDYPGARAALERALTIDEAVHGPDHPAVATDVNELGLVMHDEGNLAGARSAFERALKLGETALGPDHPTVAIGLSNLGGVLVDLGDLAGARAAFEAALKIFEKAGGADHPNMAAAVNNLGNVMREQGDLDGARAAFERALAIDEAAHGLNHPTVAIDVNNLGMVLRLQAQLAGARAAFERALKIDEAVYGPDHPTVARDTNNLGNVLLEQGDLAGAHAAFERALKISEVIYGRDHPRVAIAITNFGSLLRAQGDLAGARAALERALKIDEAVYGPDHPAVATDVANVGIVLRDQGDLAGARAALERALRTMEATLGPGHPTTKFARKNFESL